MDKNKYLVDEKIVENDVKNKKKKKFLGIISLVGFITLIVIGITVNIIDTKQELKKADSYLEENDCLKAEEIYKKLNKESKYLDKTRECNYENAISFYEKKDYESAYKLFLKLSDYKESKKYYLDAYYNYSKYLLENGNYEESVKILYDILEYEDSKTLLSEAKVKLIKNAKVGEIVYLGEFEQDGNVENGKEPLEWIVLAKSDDNILLISKYILKKMRFGSTYLWEKSEVRKWLNNDFYNEVFNETELKYIHNMITSNKTDDMIFCLSSEEARLLFSSDEERIAKPTEKLIKDEFKLSTNKAGNWWTRSVSRASNGKGVVPVESDGNVRSAGTNELAPEEYTYVDIGVRPAISINVNSMSSETMNMKIYGHDSNTSLDNEPSISSNSSSSSSSSNTRKCSGGAVECRSGFHPCNPNKNDYCVSCCKY